MSSSDPSSTSQADKRRSIPVIPPETAIKMPSSPAWDIIPYEDVIWGPRLGKGAFGSVYKGSYLGLDIALKEVEPSNSYKVEKYFEREWRIMRECRHPNIVQFIGLYHEPEENGRVFIVSEYVPRGNLRTFLRGRREFPWRMRISFATDIARALAYLHARDCIHRDLKGENLLVTANDRIKMTDFGFARITQNIADQRNMTYCGTDWYMSPEMMNGKPFGLPTDIFTLGILFVEIAAKRVVDEKTFQIREETLTLNRNEVYKWASPGCPPDFLDLALDCCKAEPDERPIMTEVLGRLRMIELDVLRSVPESQTTAVGSGAEHVGSLKLVKHGHGRNMPDFHPEVHPADRVQQAMTDDITAPRHDDTDEEGVRRMEEDALAALSRINIDGSGPTPLSEISDTSDVIIWRTATWSESKIYRDSEFSASSESSFGHKDRLLHEHTPESRLLGSPQRHTQQSEPSASQTSDSESEVPMVAVQNASVLDNATPAVVSTNPSVRTIRPPMPSSDHAGEVSAEAHSASSGPAAAPAPPRRNLFAPPSPKLKPTDKGDTAQSQERVEVETTERGGEGDGKQSSEADKLKTRYSSETEKEQEDEPAELADRALGTHRFTVITKAPDSKRTSGLTSALSFAFWSKPQGSSPVSASKCKVCNRKLGLRPALQCDDCGTIVHATCSHSTPRDCHLVGQSAAQHSIV